jgi:mono/diheme cytochrome c family protein
MLSRIHRPLRQALLGASATLGLVAAASADGDSPVLRTPMLSRYQQECAACHLAYPPGMLPSASWQRLMSGLSRHFGTDASLDPATAKELDAWLRANAGSYKKAQRDTALPPQDRITRSSWFLREHDEVAPATWKLPLVNSASNCAACHRGADQGVFHERDIRIPR